MRYLSIVMILSLIGLVHGYDVRVVNKVVQTNKYTWKGKAVWNDVEKATIMESHTSSSPILSINFLPVIVPANEQSIIDDLNTDKESTTRSKALNEISRRKSAEYVSDKGKLQGLGLSNSAIRKILK